MFDTVENDSMYAITNPRVADLLSNTLVSIILRKLFIVVCLKFITCLLCYMNKFEVTGPNYLIWVKVFKWYSQQVTPEPAWEMWLVISQVAFNSECWAYLFHKLLGECCSRILPSQMLENTNVWNWHGPYPWRTTHFITQPMFTCSQ